MSKNTYARRFSRLASVVDAAAPARALIAVRETQREDDTLSQSLFFVAAM